MCGIAGYLQIKAGPGLTASDLRDMTATLKHRGPDDDGFYAKGPIGLGMRRFSIVDLKGGAQPIANERNNVWTVFNGESTTTWRSERTWRPRATFLGANPTPRLLVHGYEEWGEGFLGRLRGCTPSPLG
jgi:asparagine synthase (glutamine-hydrolysing)